MGPQFRTQQRSPRACAADGSGSELPAGPRDRAINVRVTARQQTAVEQREFESALDLLLSELVRQALAQKQEGHTHE